MIIRWLCVMSLLFFCGLSAASAAVEICGGIAGKQCGSGEFCKFEERAQCGFGDQTGICVSRPDFCTREFMPVCGCDGKTYPNACSANAGGASVLHGGPCMGAPVKADPLASGQSCIQVVSCGMKKGVMTVYPTPCAAAADGATVILPAVGGKCPATE